jgi:hypothetical protein
VKFVKLILSTAAALFALNAEASSCRLVEQLSHPNLQNNESFWEQYASLPDPNNEEALADLMRAHGHEPEGRFGSRNSSQQSSARTQDEERRQSAPRPSALYTISHAALKGAEKIPPQARAKLDVFLTHARNGVKGMNELAAGGGDWNYKKLRGHFSGDVAYSVRLNHAYRAVFRQNRDGSLEIFAIDKDTTHR